MRSIGGIQGTAQRRAKLQEDITMHTRDDSKRIFPKSTVVDAVYMYDILLHSPRYDFSETETVEVENAVKILFVKYGDKCANESFFFKKITEEFPKFEIDSVYINCIGKFYKTTLTFLRSGTFDYSSNIKLLPKNHGVDPITV